MELNNSWLSWSGDQPPQVVTAEGSTSLDKQVQDFPGLGEPGPLHSRLTGCSAEQKQVLFIASDSLEIIC